MKVFFQGVALCLLMVFLFAGISFADQVIYSQGFESNDGGFIVNGTGEWEWGTPTNVGPASANSGSKCWGTDLDDFLNSNAIGTIDSPPISLPPLSDGQVIRVRFYADINVSEYSRGEFFISSDGETWSSLAQLIADMTNGWQMFEFDVSQYAGGNLYLRFKVSENDENPGYPGFYVDDIAITAYDNVGQTKILTLEAQESSAENASCPWVFPWNGNAFTMDNDIYSVARTQQNEYRDFYLLQKPLVETENQYRLEVREIESENSWTDMMGLIAVDHAEDVLIGVDDKGNISAYKPGELIRPVSAIKNNGEDVLNALVSRDDTGCAAYSEDFVEVNFGQADTSGGARIVLRVKGFIWGEGEEKPYIGPPAVVVKVLDDNATWKEVGRLNPRFRWSECVFNISDRLPDSTGENKIRLYSVSHLKKYHEIDFISLSTGPQPEKVVSNLNLASVEFKNSDAKSLLSNADNTYLEMTKGDEFSLLFDSTTQDLVKRDFIFVSEGYYVPKSSTYFIYTWDGTDWVTRDGFSFPGEDFSKTFDLSLFLPDSSGEYKVRIWQDYRYSPAAVDFVGLNINEESLELDYATFLRDNTDILNIVSVADDQRFNFGGMVGNRDRWIEAKWIVTGPVNRPPTTNPVKLDRDGGKVKWTYADAEGDPQTRFEIEIWSGPNATGDIIWDPPVGEGLATEADYPPGLLTDGVFYYARVKAHDGNSWGGWSQTGSATTKPIGPGAKVPDYEMMSFVHFPSDPAATSVIGLPVDGNSLRVGTYDPQIGGYIEYGDDLQITPGKAYWALSREGFNVSFDGNKVPLDEDFEHGLAYNAATGDGWNQIGCPNQAAYAWADVLVVVKEAGENSFEPISISDLAEDNEYIDIKLWRWENGAYADDTDFMEFYEGYWVKAKQANVFLIFPVNAQTEPGGLINEVRTVLKKNILLAKKWIFSPRTAVADSGDTPPMPMASLSSKDGSASSSGGGCFIDSACGTY